MRVLLLHGWGGSDFPHWQSWLAGELAKDYGCVDFIKLPDYDFPKCSVWMEAAVKEIEIFRPDIVVCHSLANTLWFHLCNEGMIADEVLKLYLVAPPSLQCAIEELESFFPVAPPHKLFAKKVQLVVSENDPYMELDEAKQLAQTFRCEIEVLHNAGHINADSGYGEWSWILENIQKEIKPDATS